MEHVTESTRLYETENVRHLFVYMYILSINRTLVNNK